MRKTIALAFKYKPEGTFGNADYRGFFVNENGSKISPFHEIPLWANETHKIANIVVEIPKGTQPKMEISKEESFNPIKQDVKNGKLRIVAIKYPFNYGAFPQTWENPATIDTHTKCKGDNDPVDAVELSPQPFPIGSVKQVKILGTFAMIDEGETDWKILCIDTQHEFASKLNDLNDIEKIFPGLLKTTFEFLRDYKIPDGKPANKFAFDDQPKDKELALSVIKQGNEEWTSYYIKLQKQQDPNRMEKLENICKELLENGIELGKSKTEAELSKRSVTTVESLKKLQTFLGSTAVYISQKSKEQEDNDGLVKDAVLIGHSIESLVDCLKEEIMQNKNNAEEIGQYRHQITENVKKIVSTPKTLKNFK